MKNKINFPVDLLVQNSDSTSYSLKILNILQGIELPGYEGKSQLSQQLVDEAAIVSDMFKLNQISALQLLLHGEDQLPQYPGITQNQDREYRDMIPQDQKRVFLLNDHKCVQIIKYSVKV